METKDILKKLDDFKSDIIDLESKLDISNKKRRLDELDSIVSNPSFWSSEDTKSVLEEQKNLRSIIAKYNSLCDSVNTLSEMLTLELNESDLKDIIDEIESLDKSFDELKLNTFLNGEFDSSNAFIEIHSGAGGTESNDWANMLYRMYTRFFEKNDYKYEVISKNEGEEVGIKGVVLRVLGYYPFGYLKGEEIVEKIENNETFYVYFGSPYCPWCRSVIEKSIEVAKKNNIDTIYYVDIWDGDHIEILRDTYQLNDSGEPELVSEVGKGYKDLLKYFDNVLSDYTLTDADGNKVSVGEKRIFAPNFIYIENGKAIKLTSAISKNQKDAREELSNKILEDEEKEFNEFFRK